MRDSSIEWTDATWNPVSGCSVISSGCSNCYAMRMAARLDAMGVSKYSELTRVTGGRSVWTGAVKTDSANFDAPMRWRKPRMIFVNSMSDLFHEGIPDSFVSQVWDTMERAHWHTFQILTKRPEHMAALTSRMKTLNNVWLGTSVESRDYLWRLDHLRQIRAVVRFVSFEPLLGSVLGMNLTDIDWAIVGGGSGPRARPMEPSWALRFNRHAAEPEPPSSSSNGAAEIRLRLVCTLAGRTWSEFPPTNASAEHGRSCRRQ